MSFLGRVFGRHSARVWRAEQRLLAGLGLATAPVAVQWIATSACELECPHCYSLAGKRLQGELSTEEFERLVLDELVALDRPELVLAGGEPLLRPDFDEIVEGLRDRRIPWSLHTHGAHVARWIEAFRSHPPQMAAVSVDGPPRQHDVFRGRIGAHASALEAIRLLKEVGVAEVIAGTTVHRDNADLLQDMLPEVLESGADGWGLHLVTPEGRAQESGGLTPAPLQLRRVAAFARRARAFLRVELDNEWGSAGVLDPWYRDAPFFCGAGRISCVVTATGEVAPCTTTDAGESAGSVRSRRLRDIWADGFAEFRAVQPGAARDPQDCWLQTRHGCSCRASAFKPGAMEPQLEALAEARS